MQCGTKLEKKVVPMLVHFPALWGPTRRGSSFPPRQTWMEVGIARRLICRFLLCKCLSLQPPHHALFLWKVVSAGMEKVFSEFGLEIRICEQTNNPFAINFCSSLGLRRNL